MIVHLPSNESLASHSFCMPQLRHPPSTHIRPVCSMSATLGQSPAAEPWPTPTSYRPVDSDLLAYRIVLSCKEGTTRLGNASETDAPVTMLSKTETRQEKSSIKRVLKPPSGDVVAAESNDFSEGLDIQTDITDNIEVEANKNLMELYSAAPAASVEVAKDTADDVVEETSAVQMSDLTHYEELSPIVRSESSESFSEDLTAAYAAADVVDLLPLNELASAVTVTEEGSLDVFEMDGKWPPLPSDEELQISSAELELSDDGELDLVESEVTGPSTPSDMSTATESGVMTKIGASEKILAHATHLTDVDSMYRFK